MAAVLDNGTLTDHDDKWHAFSIFVMNAQMELEAPMQPDQPPITGYDGSNDRKSMRDNDHTKQHDAHDFFRQRKQTAKPTPASCPANADHDDHHEADTDPNFSRRKRRKITPTNQTLLKGFIETTVGGDIQKAQADNLVALHVDPKAQPSISEAGKPQSVPEQVPISNTSQPASQEPGTREGQEAKEIAMTLVSENQIQSKPSTGTVTVSTCQDSQNNKMANKTSSAQADTRKNMKMKNGKFVQSFEVTLKYGHNQASRQSIGSRITEILASNAQNVHAAKTHPFFTGKTKKKTTKSASTTAHDVARGDETDPEGEAKATSREPVAWSDIKFTAAKGSMFKSIDAVRPIWPPNEVRHIGREIPSNMHADHKDPIAKSMKLKTKVMRIEDAEDALKAFSQTIKGQKLGPDVLPPRRRLLSGTQLANTITTSKSGAFSSPSIQKLRSLIKHGTSAFDRGEPSGQQSWTTKYAPQHFQEVLQPSCQILRDWLKSLAVHNVKSGAIQGEKRDIEKPLRKKRRQRKSADALDDFIVDDDDDDISAANSVKNAILITGPSGCGKTASVFAVAKEMDFEVFEIHPGMKRSAKDIFDKVGDMTQNHLVQRKDGQSRCSSVAPPDSDSNVLAAEDKNQPSLAGFLGARKPTNEKPAKIKPSEVPTAKKEQKQSLILFEEVDILFESDKAFWTGVQNLVQQSRRPVVLTCNDISQIPISEIELYTILEYQAPEASFVGDYLSALCASEGHIIDKRALSNLYVSKGNDLRASIAELSFWCQMTVGSQKGGLDWLFSSALNESRFSPDGEKIRICSEGTYRSGLDLYSVDGLNAEQIIQHCHDSLDIPISQWVEAPLSHASQDQDGQQTNLAYLDQLMAYNDTRSVLDIVDTEVGSMIASAISTQYSAADHTDTREKVTSLYMTKVQQQDNFRIVDIVDAFDAITVEKPTFPPSQGRLAPSVDACSTAITVDIAPYVRSIVSFDKQLEKQREELFGSQGKKSRNTRAARAAAEGGDKAHTRAERWFPHQLDFDRVLETGNDWPQWFAEERLSAQLGDRQETAQDLL